MRAIRDKDGFCIVAEVLKIRKTWHMACCLSSAEFLGEFMVVLLGIVAVCIAGWIGSRSRAYARWYQKVFGPENQY
jgi:hypothetical protein